MKLIVNDYINFIIKPLEEFRDKLLNEHHLSYDDPLVILIENDLFNKYQKLSNLL